MLNIIITKSKNNVISNDGTLPWIIPEVMQDIKNLVNGNEVVLGYNTFDFMCRLPFPLSKKTYVLSRKCKTPRIKGVSFIDSIFKIPHIGKKEIFILGGIKTFASFLSSINNRVIYYNIDKNYEGDAFMFNTIKLKEFNVIKQMSGYDYVTKETVNIEKMISEKAIS